MKLPTLKRLAVEDFSGIKEIPALCAKLFFSLNGLLTTIYSGFNNGLTLTDNLFCAVKVLSVVPGNILPGTSTTWVSFPWAYSTAPIGLQVINAVQTSSGVVATITKAVGVQWNYSAGSIYITSINGLPTSSATYNITLWVIGG